MKKSWGLGFLSLAAMAMLIGVFAGQKNTYKEAQGYTASSLPTTIDLNDTSAANIRSYYSSLNSLSTSERQGTNLLKNLKPILKNNQKYLSYDSTNSIWDVYCIVDRDWTKSPASSLPAAAGTYNSSTNKITGYNWGGNSATYENPYLHALYYNRNQTAVAQAYGDHGNNSTTGINREHIWPKGAGFDTNGAGGARGDIMHLWAAHGHTNNKHSNYYYGYVNKSQTYSDEGSDFSICSGNLLGYSKTLGGSTKVFEPQDSDKGDIARAVFYMVARYNYLSGSDSDGINSNNPNLELVNNISSFSSSGYTSSTSTTGKLGIIQDLLEWNRLDPPDEFEIHRNNLCYNNFTNNRNPFIDYPEWAEFIWGKSTNGSYNSSSTGYATPSTDSINVFSNGSSSSDPTINSVSVSPSTLNLDLNGVTTGNLTATVSVSNGAAQTVTWTSLNTSVATVNSSGVVTAQATGTATIKATSTVDNSKYDTCTVTVTDSSQQGGGTTISSTPLASSGIADGMTVVWGTSNTNLATGIDNNWVRLSNNSSSWITFTLNGSSSGFTLKNGNNYVYSSDAKKVAFSNANYTTFTLNASSYVYNASAGSYVYNDNNGSGGIRPYTTGSYTGAYLYAVTSGGGSETPTSITATVNKSFKVGETLTKSDITLKDNLNNTINDFSFNDYQFTYSDAPSGGGSRNKSFNILYNEMETTLTVSVSRSSYNAPSTSTKSLTASNNDFSAVEAESYDQSDDYTFTKEGITYSTTDSYRYSDIYLSFNTHKGTTNYYTNSIFGNITRFDKTISNIEIGLYGSKRPSISYTIEYSDDRTDDESWSTTNNGNNHFFRMRYIGEFTGFVNISTVTITLAGEETATNVANYIMYEDSEGQCDTKFSVASGYFANMSKAQRTTFMTSNDYVISTARARLTAWATSKGKTISLSNGDYVIASNRNLGVFNGENNSTMIVVVAVSALSLLAIGMLVLKYKKKEE